jgi:deoxyribodipyrimidine photolyase
LIPARRGHQERQRSSVTASDQGTAGAPAAPASQPQAGTNTTETTALPAAPQAGESGTESSGTTGAEAISLDEARKLRQEAHSLRQRLAAAEKKVTEHEDAKLSEQDRLQKRATELEAAVQQAQAAERTLRTRLAVERAAHGLRFVDVADAYALLDAGAIEYGEDGEPKNVDTLLKALVKAKPYLAQPEQPAAPTAPEYQRPAPIGATPRPENGRATSEALLRDTETAAQRRVRQLWG